MQTNASCSKRNSDTGKYHCLMSFQMLDSQNQSNHQCRLKTCHTTHPMIWTSTFRTNYLEISKTWRRRWPCWRNSFLSLNINNRARPHRLDSFRYLRSNCKNSSSCLLNHQRSAHQASKSCTAKSDPLKLRTPLKTTD